MSNLSTGNSNATYRGPKVVGILSKCWCGSAVVYKTSKPDNNPGRRYYRCHLAYMNKLGNNEHIFPWTDEAILNEIDRMTSSIKKIEKHLIDLENNGLELQRKELELTQLKMESVIAERIDSIVRESEWKMKKWVVASLVFGAIVIVGFIKM